MLDIGGCHYLTAAVVRVPEGNLEPAEPALGLQEQAL